MSETKVNPYKVIGKLRERDRYKVKNPFHWKSVANAYEAFTGEALPEDLPRNREERAIFERVYYSLNDLWQTVGLRDEVDS